MYFTFVSQAIFYIPHLSFSVCRASPLCQKHLDCSENVPPAMSHAMWSQRKSLPVNWASVWSAIYLNLCVKVFEMVTGTLPEELKNVATSVTASCVSCICQKRLKVPAARSMSHVWGEWGGSRVADYPASHADNKSKIQN